MVRNQGIFVLNETYIMPKVTVLMSVYNGERYLKESIDSILQQTFTDFEFLIINDGSTDATQDIIVSYHDPRIRVIVNESNIGLTRSLNKGLSLAQGEYIARQDVDDISFPARLEKQVAFLQQHDEVGMVGTDFLVIDKRGQTIVTIQPPSDHADIKVRLWDENVFCHGSVMFKKTCLLQVGRYREPFKYAQDYDLWLRIAEYFDIANLPEPLYYWRLNVSAVSIAHHIQQHTYTQIARLLANERRRGGKDWLQKFPDPPLKLIERFTPLITYDKNNIIQNYLHWSELFFEHKNYTAAFEVLMRSLWYAPLKVKNWKKFVKFILYLFYRIHK
jgi:glycosyltransferase involved in cell wall biosynthesis